MKTKETIAIIGATGNMGSAIARNLVKHNYRLILMSRNPEELSELKHSLSSVNAKAVIDTNDCVKDVSWEADIIILACPYEAEKDIAEKIREVAVGKVVISISNPLNARYRDLVMSPHTSAGEELQKLLPESKVVKAFNTTLAADFTSPVIDGKISDVFIAANNGNSLEVVSGIVAAAGFNPVVAGDLSVSRTLERMMLKQIQIGLRNRYDWLAGWKILAN
jgi:predicted dinucleotide-binding enzyme